MIAAGAKDRTAAHSRRNDLSPVAPRPGGRTVVVPTRMLASKEPFRGRRENLQGCGGAGASMNWDVPMAVTVPGKGVDSVAG